MKKKMENVMKQIGELCNISETSYICLLVS